ncbi:hypothetical protein PG987_004460 [Apiospora arundinis]
MAAQSGDGHDAGDYDDSGSSPRPSFIKFWKKRSKSKPGPRRNLTFVAANPAVPGGGQEGPNNDGGGGGGVSKAEARRAQVRRAQIQHRERKANYARGLEADIVRLRGDIERCRMDCRVLAGENQGMRQRLLASTTAATSIDAALPPDATGADHSTDLSMAAPENDTLMTMNDGLCQHVDNSGIGDYMPPPQDYRGDKAATTNSPIPAWASSSCFFDSDPGYMIALGINESLGAPAFQATRRPMTDHEASASFAETNNVLDRMSGKEGKSVRDCSLEETDKAVNFILALEHTCWDHFKTTDFQLNDASQPSTEAASASTGSDTGDPDHGHTLMVSAMALQQAPESVLQHLENRTATCGAAAAAAAAATSSSPSHIFSSFSSSSPEIPPPPPPPLPSRVKTDGSIAWPATGITLESLHGLASALNPPDLELTPVQAWFEMVRAYDVRTLILDADGGGSSTLDRLVAELKGVVKCLHFGALIERAAFDSAAAQGAGGTRAATTVTLRCIHSTALCV